MLGSPAGPGAPSQRGLWASASIPSAASFTSDGFSKYGVYSLFPGGPTFGSALYSHSNTFGRFTSTGHIQPAAGNIFHGSHKDSLFSSGGYTFGAPTPPPGSPYSPIPVAQLELLTKGLNSNIIIQQSDFVGPAKRAQITEQPECCRKACDCRAADGDRKCHDWGGVNIKKEPGGHPCQVAEISTSISPVVKVEIASPTQKIGGKEDSMHDSSQAGMAAGTAVGGAGGGTVLQCTDDRATALASWPVGGASSLTTPTLWQYPAPVPMESMVPLPVPMPPVGFQLVRDPTTGGLLLLPATTSLEPIQQAVVWPSYPQQSSLLIPPLPPPPLQLLSSTSDYLASSATLQHTQTHSTRLVAVTTDTKRKMPLPATTLIKIETDALDQTKTISTMANSSGAIFSDQNMAPLVTTHVIYQHPTNLILSQTPTVEATSKEQATSPVSCLTPPPEVAVETHPPVQDASNQTDNITSEDDNTTQTVSDIVLDLKVAEEEKVGESTVEKDTKIEEDNTKEVSPDEPTPDLSGLELLSNSIVEFETCRNKEDPEEVATPAKEDSLGGLDLLCALAEQRILEESDARYLVKEKKSSKKEKRKSRRHSDEPRHKKRKSDKYYSDEDRCKEQKLASDKKGDIKCMCHLDYKSYKTPQSEEEVKRFIASRSQGSCCKGDWPCMNALELDMRMKLADLQRQYREKQKELSKLKVKKYHPCCRKKSRKKSSHSEKSVSPPPTPINSLDELNSQTPEPCKEYKPIEQNHSSDAETSLKRKHSTETREKTPERKSSSKKRKVGRPKKLSELYIPTETIVAKKSKSGFVSYLMAAKEKYQSQNGYPDSPPRYTEEYFVTKKNKNNNDVVMSASKIRPKLKAEATVKTYDEQEWETEEEIVEMEEDAKANDSDMEEEPVQETEIIETREVKPHVCVLTEEHLKEDKLRVLTAMGGLFYAGLLNAVEPPDVYSITLDGERGNRPHIMSREEILRDAIVEVAPKSPEELKVGTRLCAYWSQQYRCLYPGSVAEPGSPNPQLDSKFISVEFDDGDSGTIAIEDIRLLPSDYPIMEYDPNPLQSLCKRRRRTSTCTSVEEKKPVLEEISTPQEPDEEPEPVTSTQKEHKKKKKKRNKNKLSEKKKKKRKHSCSDENCDHKKHRKHRKHKKHHYDKNEEKSNEPVENEWIDLEESEEKVVEENEEIPDVPINPDEEVTVDDVLEAQSKAKKVRDRQESCESSRSKMSAFLPAKQFWNWYGKGIKRPKGKGKVKKKFYRAIQRDEEMIKVGDAAVFLSTGRPDRPFIGKIVAMWEECGDKNVKIKWFYHPEETDGSPLNFKYPGALYASSHIDDNDVQTISHKCEVVPLPKFIETLDDDPKRYETIYDDNELYYLAGHFNPATKVLKFDSSIPLM